MCVASLFGRLLRGKPPNNSRTKNFGLLLARRAFFFFFVAFVLLSCCECCPDKCLCSTQTVKCQNQDLRVIPHPLPANTRQLFVTGNKIPRVGAESFPSRLDLLTELRLNGNELQFVDPGAFHNLPNLERVDLSNNSIVDISAAAFLDDNKLQALNFSSSFHYNHSEVLSVLLQKANFVRLAHLDLSNNHMVVLPDGIFTDLPNLTNLSLQNCSIVSLTNGSLRVPPLQELDLRDNSLRELPNATLADLSLKTDLQVRMAGNPWRCDCFIEDLVVWLKGSDQVTDAQNLTCVDPEGLRNLPLLQLEPSQLECNYSGDMKGVLETSYVFLGMVLALIGVIFLLVLYLNRKGIKRWIYNIRDACRDHMEGYHYRYEINTDPRMANLSINSDV